MGRVDTVLIRFKLLTTSFFFDIFSFLKYVPSSRKGSDRGTLIFTHNNPKKKKKKKNKTKKKENPFLKKKYTKEKKRRKTVLDINKLKRIKKKKKKESSWVLKSYGSKQY